MAAKAVLWASVVVGIYLVWSVSAWVAAGRLMFQPHPASSLLSNEQVTIHTADGERLSAVFLRASGALPTILYSHGNAEDLGDLLFSLEQFRCRGYSVLAYDYRGYGLSSGRPTESGTYADIHGAYRYLTVECGVPWWRIIVWGRSIGSGPATWLATREKVGGLVLESAFLSAIRTVTQMPLTLFDRYNNARRIRLVSCPVLIIHGRRDYVVPIWHGMRLYDRAQWPKYSVWLDAGHNDIMESAAEEFWRATNEFAKVVMEYGPGVRHGAE